MPLLVLLPSLALAAAQPQVTIKVEGEQRVVTSNGIANHAMGDFPNRGNPHAIAPQSHVFRMPAKPKAGPDFTRPQSPTTWGVAVNGVPLDPNTAEYWNNDRSSGWNLDLMAQPGRLGIDKSNAHVQPNGAYHYHAIPAGLVDALGGDKGRMLLLGYAADGFPVYSANGHRDPKDPRSQVVALRSGYRLKKADRQGGPGGKPDGTYTADWEWAPGGDLDEANGRFGVTPEYPQGTYAYHITETFPFIPRMFRGSPDPSFRKQPGGAGGGPGRPRRPGPGGPGGPPSR